MGTSTHSAAVFAATATVMARAAHFAPPMPTRQAEEVSTRGRKRAESAEALMRETRSSLSTVGKSSRTARGAKKKSPTAQGSAKSAVSASDFPAALPRSPSLAEERAGTAETARPEEAVEATLTRETAAPEKSP